MNQSQYAFSRSGSEELFLKNHEIMKNIRSVSLCLFLLLIIACQREDSDYEAARKAAQDVIDQVAHTWQFSQFRIPANYSDTVLSDAGYLQFVRCEVNPENLSTCEEGYYELEGQETVSFRYDVVTPSPLMVLIRPNLSEGAPSTPESDLYGNWKIMKVAKDSLVLEEDDRVMRLFKE